MTRHDGHGLRLDSYRQLRESVHQLLTGYEAELEQHQATLHQLDDFVVAASSEDGQVNVSVDGHGALVELDLGWETFGRYTPKQLAETIVATIRLANQHAGEQIKQLPANRQLETDLVRGNAKPVAVPTETR
ncbi:MAG: YbaB/EbfC family nucleoid-associated protein [Sciscionella sp.]|nr:YbaB/EbfC family nucleoid-associated protein [Sciscionella sp.]